VYEEEEKEVVVVGVGNANLPDENTLRTEIQKVFGSGVVKIDLSIKPNYTSNSWDLNGDGKLAAGNFNLLQDYSSEMRELSSDWLDANDIDKDAYVLFVVSGFDEQNVDKGGYMPLGRHKGFIKSGSSLKVYSHELAHGIFGLEHTFPEVNEGNTNNLLDYSDGVELNYDQWEKMRWNLSRFDLLNDEEENFYNMTFVDQNPTLNQGQTLPIENPCYRFLSKFGKIISFNSEQRGEIESYQVVDGKLHGVTKLVSGVPKRFVQASAANYVTANNTKTITSIQDNQALICFECLDERCSQVENFTGPEVCEVMNVTGLNGQTQKLYNRVPSPFLIDLRNFTSECYPGIEVMTGSIDGILQCKTLTEEDCNQNMDGSGGVITGEELVAINEIPDENYDCDLTYSWIDLNRNAIKTNNFTALSAREFVLGFKNYGREYVACFAGGINSLENQSFYIYVDKEKFNQKKSELASSQLEIRVKDLTDDMIFKENDFTKSVSGDVIHYRVYDRFGCFFEYYFSHDGREKYELDGQQFDNVIRSVYARRSCALEILRRAICGTLIAGTEEFAEFAGEYLSMLHIPSTVYDPENPDYEKFYYEAYSGSSPDVFFGTDETSKLEFAFTCGLINGVADEAEGLVDAFPMIALYICDENFRNQINEALENLDLSTIQNAIEEDFQGNQYLKAEATGRYVIAVISMVIPISKANLAAKSMSIISKVKALPAKLMTFIRYVKNGGINGLKVVRGNIQKIIFVNAFNVEIELARFTEDGVMVIDESRIISQLPNNPTTLFDIGETSYKTSDNLPAKTGELKVVKGGDGEVWVVTKDLFKVGDNIAGVTIQRLRIGTNNKIVIIGRQMNNHVYKVAESIKLDGKYVEVLDDAYLEPLYNEGFEFIIEGKKWTVNSAWDDMVNNPDWLPYKDSKGHILNEHLDKTPMYKLNKMWIEKAHEEGATIIDIGYPSDHDMSISAFYEMERTTIIWD
jgi:hypothetical protein